MKHRNCPKDGLFFIFKFWIMRSLETSIFLSIVFYLGSITFWQAFILGMPLFVMSFAIGRYLERHIDRLARKVTKKLDSYPRLRKIIVKYM